MIAYHFRFIDDDGKPTEWIGTAFAANKTSLFWEIDFHGDPYTCEVKRADFGSFCFRQLIPAASVSSPHLQAMTGKVLDGSATEDEAREIADLVVTSIHLGSNPPDVTDDGWRAPIWGDVGRSMIKSIGL